MKKLICLAACLMLAGCSDDNGPTQPTGKDLGPEGSLYVLNQADGTVYVYNSKTGERMDSLLAEVPAPHHIELSPDHEFFYVVSRSTPGQVAKFAVDDNSFVNKFVTAGTVFPTSMATTVSGQFGYLADFTASPTTGKLLKYDLGTLTLANGNIQSGSGTHDVKVSHDGSTVVACNRFTDDLTIVNTTNDQVEIVSLNETDPSLPGQPKYGPYGVVFDSQDSLVYVACLDSNANQIRVFDLAARAVVDSILIPFDNSQQGPGKFAGPTLMALKNDDTQLWVTTYWGNSVVVVNPSTKAVLADIPFATPSPFGVHLSDDESRAYVACANAPNENGRIYIINTQNFQKVDSLTVGRNPFMVHYHASHDSGH